MTVHHELPTSADFATLAGPHHPAITIYAATSPVVNERERAEVSVKSAFDHAVDQLRQGGASTADLDALRRERDGVLGDYVLWGGLSRSLAIFVAPGFSEVFVLPNRLDDAWHVGSHFTLGQLLRSTSQDQEAFALTFSSNEWALWHATPAARATPIETDPAHPANLDAATNRDTGETSPRGGLHGDRGEVGDERGNKLLDIYAKRVADATKQELAAIDPDGRIPLFVFAAEPQLSTFLDRSHNGRRVVGVPGSPDRLTAAEIDAALREQLARLNIAEASEALDALAEGAAGRVERDLAAIARSAADGAVETLWFDFTTSVNGTLDRETGAVEFAGANGDGDALADGTPAGDLLPQIALIVLAKGGRVVTVRGEDLGEGWSAPAVAWLRFALT